MSIIYLTLEDVPEPTEENLPVLTAFSELYARSENGDFGRKHWAFPAARSQDGVLYEEVVLKDINSLYTREGVTYMTNGVFAFSTKEYEEYHEELKAKLELFGER